MLFLLLLSFHSCEQVNSYNVMFVVLTVINICNRVTGIVFSKHDHFMPMVKMMTCISQISNFGRLSITYSSHSTQTLNPRLKEYGFGYFRAQNINLIFDNLLLFLLTAYCEVTTSCIALCRCLCSQSVS